MCLSVCGLSRVLAHPQVLKAEQPTRVQRHQHVASLHDVESEGPGADDDPLGLGSQGQHHPVLILGQEREAEEKETPIKDKHFTSAALNSALLFKHDSAGYGQENRTSRPFNLPGHSRLGRRLPDEHVWDFIARLQRLQLVNLHPRYVSLETVELEQETHLRAESSISCIQPAWRKRTASVTIASHM